MRGEHAWFVETDCEGLVAGPNSPTRKPQSEVSQTADTETKVVDKQNLAEQTGGRRVSWQVPRSEFDQSSLLGSSKGRACSPGTAGQRARVPRGLASLLPSLPSLPSPPDDHAPPGRFNGAVWCCHHVEADCARSTLASDVVLCPLGILPGMALIDRLVAN